jgi:hypothetical protein
MSTDGPGDALGGIPESEWEDPPGNCHICLIYDSEEQRDAIVRDYLGAGLRKGELVRYFADGTPPTVATMLAEHGRTADSGDGARVQFRFATAAAAYYPDGRFDPQRQIAGMVRNYDLARDDGFPGVRTTGEMTWALGDVPGSDRLVEYETLINTVRHGFPHHGMCQYDARRFDGATIFQVLRVHPQVVAGGHVVQNPYFVGREASVADRQPDH